MIFFVSVIVSVIVIVVRLTSSTECQLHVVDHSGYWVQLASELVILLGHTRPI